MRRVYDTIRLFSRRKTVQSKPLKDKNGLVLTRTEDQLNRWKEYFQEVLENRRATARHSNRTNHHGRGQEILEILEEWKGFWV